MTDWWLEPARAVDEETETQAQQQLQLTKPAGSLGRLETLAIQFAGLQGKPLPASDRATFAQAGVSGPEQ